MRALADVLAVFWAEERWRFLGGAALSVLTIAAGTALLGLSGWFITASAVAGMVGVGLTFDFFRPSAGIRFLALARTASRYGERLVTHDATLAFLARVRRRVFNHFAARDFIRLGRLKSGEVLARIVADVDSLDAVYLRLFVPTAGAVAMIGLASAFIAIYSGTLAATIAAVLFAGLALAAVVAVRLGARAGRRIVTAREALRIRLIDLTNGLIDLVFAGRLDRQRAAIVAADAAEAEAARTVNRAEIWSSQILFLSGQFTLLATLALGIPLVLADRLSIAVLTMILLAVLALQEALGQTARGFAAIGRTLLAARRLSPCLAGAGDGNASGDRADGGAGTTGSLDESVLISIENIGYTWPGGLAPCFTGIDFDIRPGDRIGLEGASGAGKSTLLAVLAGLLEAGEGRVRRTVDPGAGGVAFLPQRSALFAGTIAENLRLAAPEASDGDLWNALEIAQLKQDVETLPDGLATRLGERGAGLSGGQKRRLAVARVILTRPRVCLLDEPTEGIPQSQGEILLRALFAVFPDVAFIVATHRERELELVDRVVKLLPNRGGKGV